MVKQSATKAKQLNTKSIKHGYFEAPNGNKSSTRLIGFVVVIAALILAQEVVYFGKDNPVTAAASEGTIFITIAGPVLAFLFKQKQTETQIRH